MFNHFATPQYFWLLLIVAFYLVWEIWIKEKSSLNFSNIFLIKRAVAKSSLTAQIATLSLRTVALLFLIFALARPQIVSEQKQIYRHGIDIIITLDTSGSMSAEDLDGNRLQSSKKIIQNFIRARKDDRIGLVIFGGNALTKAPLTFDHNLLINLLTKINLGDAGDGTAIGQAIVTALNRLRDSDAKSKIIILLTDGENNLGNISPVDAAKLAKQLGIKIYTIGIGDPNGTPLSFNHPTLGKQYYRNPDGSYVLTKLDLATLTEIADITDSRFFKAPNSKQLQEVFNEIDKLEKVKLETDVHYNHQEVFIFYLLTGLLTALLEFILSKTIFRRLPCIW